MNYPVKIYIIFYTINLNFRKTVLTAAHCVHDGEEFYVQLGKMDLSDSSVSPIFKVQKSNIKIHEDFSRSKNNLT